MKSSLPKIIIENNSFKKTPKEIKHLGHSFTIITDLHLKKLAEELLKSVRGCGLRCNLIILPPGEKTKSLSFVEKIARSLVRLGVKRDGVLIALGGGVIGDLVGFIASIYMRGIRYVAVPTTLLAMTDSSIGSKTGVDFPEGKNLLGSFCHPALVVIDPLLLKGLPDRDFHAGFSEVIKHAIIEDKKFFAFLEKNARKILNRNMQTVKKVIAESVRIKLKIVKGDEKESLTGKPDKSRMLLNYGHTVGHALEKLSNYALGHGNAVAIGMVAENRLAVGKNLLNETDSERIINLIKNYGLPTKIPLEFSQNAIKKAMELDKKTIGDKLYFALPTKIGQAKIIGL